MAVRSSIFTTHQLGDPPSEYDSHVRPCGEIMVKTEATWGFDGDPYASKSNVLAVMQKVSAFQQASGITFSVVPYAYERFMGTRPNTGFITWYTRRFSSDGQLHRSEEDTLPWSYYSIADIGDLILRAYRNLLIAHSLGISYGDVQAKNFAVIDKCNPQFLLFDFGEARFVKHAWETYDDWESFPGMVCQALCNRNPLRATVPEALDRVESTYGSKLLYALNLFPEVSSGTRSIDDYESIVCDVLYKIVRRTKRLQYGSD